MGCGCVGSTQQQASNGSQANQPAVQQKPAAGGVSDPGYFWNGPDRPAAPAPAPAQG